MTSEKLLLLKKLADKRRQQTYPGYLSVSEFHDGKHDCDFVSPYSKGACNVSSKLFLLLQDWSSEEELKGPEKPEQIRLGRTPSLPTNKNLSRLLSEVYGVTLADTFATNLFPFIKPGRISEKIPMELLVQAAKEYAIPQIEIVAPQIVICFGMPVFQAMRVACGLNAVANAEEARANPFKLGDVTVFQQAHPGGLGIANRRGFENVLNDWIEMRGQMDNVDNSDRKLPSNNLTRTKPRAPKLTHEVERTQESTPSTGRELQSRFLLTFQDYMDNHDCLFQPGRQDRERKLQFRLGRSGTQLCIKVLQQDNIIRVEFRTTGKNADVFYQQFVTQRSKIEEELGESPEWRAKEGNNRKQIILNREICLADESRWPEYCEWLLEKLNLFYRVFAPRVEQLQTGSRVSD